jgi:hypothetical protein
MDHKEIWEIIKWTLGSIVGLAVLYLGIKSFKKDAHGAIYKKIDDNTTHINKRIDDLECRKADRPELEKISKQNADQIASHVTENNTQFTMILTYMESVDKKVDNLNQNIIALLQKKLK